MADREKLIELLEEVPHPQRLYPDLYVDRLIAKGVTVCEHGRWVDAYGIHKSKCTSCGVAFGRVMDADCYFCPNCGADMRGTEDA